MMGEDFFNKTDHIIKRWTPHPCTGIDCGCCEVIHPFEESSGHGHLQSCSNAPRKLKVFHVKPGLFSKLRYYFFMKK